MLKVSPVLKEQLARRVLMVLKVHRVQLVLVLKGPRELRVPRVPLVLKAVLVLELKELKELKEYKEEMGLLVQEALKDIGVHFGIPLFSLLQAIHPLMLLN